MGKKDGEASGDRTEVAASGRSGIRGEQRRRRHGLGAKGSEEGAPQEGASSGGGSGGSGGSIEQSSSSSSSSGATVKGGPRPSGGKDSGGAAQPQRSKTYLTRVRDALPGKDFAVFRGILKRYKTLKDQRDKLQGSTKGAPGATVAPVGPGDPAAASAQQSAQLSADVKSSGDLARGIFIETTDLFHAAASNDTVSALVDGFRAYVPRYWKSMYDNVLSNAETRRENLPTAKRGRIDNGGVRRGESTQSAAESTSTAGLRSSLSGTNTSGTNITGGTGAAERRPAAVTERGTRKQCGLCRKPPTAPFRAKCGHICCHSCWQDWIRRSKSSSGTACMICQHRPVKRKTLEKVFF